MSEHLFVSSGFQKQLNGVELVPPDTPPSPSLPDGADYSISQWVSSNQANIIGADAYAHPMGNGQYILHIVISKEVAAQGFSTPKRGDKIYLDISELSVVGEITAGSAGETNDAYEYNLIVTPISA